MRYSGTEQISATRQRVWQFLTNPDVVAQCVPDVESLEVVDPIHFKAMVKAGIGPVRGKFKVKVELIPDPSRHHLDMKMSGGGFGSANEDPTVTAADPCRSSAATAKWPPYRST